MQAATTCTLYENQRPPVILISSGAKVRKDASAGEQSEITYALNSAACNPERICVSGFLFAWK